MLQTKLVYAIFLSFGMRCRRSSWMVPVPLMLYSGGRLFPTPLVRRCPPLPLSHVAAFGPFISVLSDGCFLAVSGSVDKFDMWWAYAEGISDWARR